MIKQPLFLILLVLTLFSNLSASEMSEYRDDCKRNDDVACYHLAELYYLGTGVKQNFKTAMHYYGKSCNLGLDTACTYFKIAHDPLDYKLEKSLIREHCKNPKQQTCIILKKYFQKEIQEEKDTERCEAGGVRECRKIADNFASNVDDNISIFNKVSYFYAKACNFGDGYSCHKLAHIYETRQHQEQKDYAKEIEKYAQKGCDTNHIESCLYLSKLYNQGVVLKQNHKKSFQILEHACNQNDRSSCIYLAQMTYKGDGVAQDIPRAIKKLESYCAIDNGVACFFLGTIYNKEQDKNKAVDFYDKACDLGQKVACKKEDALEDEIEESGEGGFPWFKTIIIIIAVLFILSQFSDYPIEEEQTEPLEEETKKTFLPKTFRILPKRRKPFKCKSCGARQLEKDEERYFCSYCKTVVEWTN